MFEFKSGRNFKGKMGWLFVPAICLSMASCATTQKAETTKPRSKEYFSEKEYGVRASPRVADGKNIPKGGGRYMLGKPYQVKGKTYVPKEDMAYNKSGLASWYGSAFHGRLTANGEVYDQLHLSAAHPTFPLPSYARVTNMDTGSSVIVRVNDRGPYHPGRIIDVSNKAADLLDIKRTGTAKVNVQYVGKAPLDGHDMPYLMASYTRKGDRLPQVAPEGQIASGVMVASNTPMRQQMQTYSSSTSMSTALNGSTPSNGGNRPSAFAMMSASAEENAAAASQSSATYAALPQFGPVPMPRPMMAGQPVVVAQQAVASSGVAYAKPQAQSAAFAAVAPQTARAPAMVWSTGAQPMGN